LPGEAENMFQVVFSVAHGWKDDALMRKGKAKIKTAALQRNSSCLVQLRI